MLFRYSFLLTLLLHGASAFLLKPSLPSNDPFYSVPANISAYRVGDVISWRKTPQQVRAMFDPLPIKSAWQFLVRSTDGVGNATAIVTTVIEPHNADPNKVLSYQFAEDSSNPNCAPSYLVLSGASVDSMAMQVEAYFMKPALSRGWYVVAPDYEGPQASFTVGRQSGRATLDSIRAILASEKITGIKKDAHVAMWGYSGGSIATGWAAQLQPDYAPELSPNLIGAAVGGWCTNLTATVEACDGTIFAGLVANGINGLLNQYPWIKQRVYNKLTFPFMQFQFTKSNSVCWMGSMLQYSFASFFGGFFPWFYQGWRFFSDDLIAPLLRENTLAYKVEDGVPEIPLFLYHSKADSIIPIVGAERGYNNYCEWGIESMEFASSETSGHLVEALEGAGAALRWLDDRFSGKQAVTGCHRTDRLTNLDYPDADLDFYYLFRTAMLNSMDSKPGAGYNKTVPYGNGSIPDSDQSTVAALVKLLGGLGVIPMKRDLNGGKTLDYEEIATMMIMGQSSKPRD